MGLLQDDFDYTPPPRGTNWTLPKEESAYARRMARPAREVNRTADISGARSAPHAAMQRPQRRDLSLEVGDIAGARPAPQIPTEVRRRNRALETRDITAQIVQKTFETKRCTDPLAPQYAIPAVAQAPPPALPFLRDTLSVADINGPRRAPRSTSAPRNPLDLSDIPLARSSAPRFRGTDGSLRNADIQGSQPRGPRGGRRSNPLDPVYTVADPGHATRTVGPVDGSNPRPPRSMRADRPDLSLLSHDIEGAAPASHVPYPQARRGWKETCRVDDIDTKARPFQRRPYNPV